MRSPVTLVHEKIRPGLDPGVVLWKHVCVCVKLRASHQHCHAGARPTILHDMLWLVGLRWEALSLQVKGEVVGRNRLVGIFHGRPS